MNSRNSSGVTRAVVALVLFGVVFPACPMAVERGDTETSTDTGTPTLAPDPTPEPSTAPATPEPPTEVATPEPATVGDDDSAQRVRAEDILKVKGAGARVDVQQQVIDRHVRDAEAINDDLAALLEQVRREQGLPPEDPYISPVQKAIDPVIQMQQGLESSAIAKELGTPAPPASDATPAD